MAHMLKNTSLWPSLPAAPNTTTSEYYTSEDYCNYMSIMEKTAPIDLTVYPNPATDFVNIELGNLQKADLQNAMTLGKKPAIANAG